MNNMDKLTKEINKLEAQLGEKKKALAEEQEKAHLERQNVLQNFTDDLLNDVLKKKLHHKQKYVPEDRDWIHENRPAEYAYVGSDEENQGVYLYGTYDRKGEEHYCTVDDSDALEKVVITIVADKWDVKDVLDKHGLG